MEDCCGELLSCSMPLSTCNGFCCVVSSIGRVTGSPSVAPVVSSVFMDLIFFVGKTTSSVVSETVAVGLAESDGVSETGLVRLFRLLVLEALTLPAWVVLVAGDAGLSFDFADTGCDTVGDTGVLLVTATLPFVG